MRSSKRAMVFLVDDDDDFRRSVEVLLEAEGHLVLGARDGVEALARMRGTFGRSIAVIDLMMPGMDGRGLCGAMRMDPALRHVPIVVVSAEECDTVEGADLVLAKQCGAERLCAVLDHLLAQ